MPPTHHDVIVLGGGTMGTAAAWELGKRGVKALVLEQFRHVHTLGSHGGKTRIIRHAYAEGEDYVPIVRRADNLWLALEQERGGQLLVRTGGLDLAAQGYGYARAARRSAETHHLPFEWLEPAEVRRRWPVWQIPDDWDACFNPMTGYLLVDPALHALADAARALGVAIHDEEPAREWGGSPDGVWVRTDRATYQADRLIVATGAWAGETLTSVGIPFTVVRKTLWWLALDNPDAFAPDRFPVFICESDAGSIYGFPHHGDGTLKIAKHDGGDVTTPDEADRTTQDAEKRAVVPFAQRLLRGVTDRVAASTVCLYEMTPDQDFVVDRHPEWPRVVIGAGFSGHGFKFAPAIGEHLADLALDPSVAPYPRFRIDRFAGRAVEPYQPDRVASHGRYHDLVVG